MRKIRSTRKGVLAGGRESARCNQTVDRVRASFDSTYDELYLLVETSRFSLRHKDLLQVALNNWYDLRVRDLEHLDELLAETSRDGWEQIPLNLSGLSSVR